MSGLGAWLWGTSQLDDAIDKATSELLPAGSEDIALNLEICDQIRSKSVSAKDAMRVLKRRLNHKNPNVQLLTLGLTDICVKNGGDHFLAEIASREFMDNLVSILKMPGLNHEVKNTILRLIQNWSVAFEGKYSLSYVGQVYKTLQGEGFKFPPKDLALANSAMVDTQTAPEWIDSDVCLRCRTPFSFTNRKHHCRNCGQIFDQQCSSKNLPLPHFGITQDVRVCDGCYTKLTRKDKADKRHRSTGSLNQSQRHKSARELADEELQRAIELSIREASSPRGYAPSSSYSSWQPSEPPLVDNKYSDRKTATDYDDDPDLKAAIEASLLEANAPRPSAPVALETPKSEQPSFTYGTEYSQANPPAAPNHPPLPKLPNYDLDPLETDAILTFNQTVEQVQAHGGRDLSRYPAVTELYDKANSLRPKLALSLDDAERKEEMLAEMNEKLSQAVKLYDQILTEQVMHPRWRNSYSSPTYQTAPSNHGQNQRLPSQASSPQGTYQPQPAPTYAPSQAPSWVPGSSSISVQQYSSPQPGIQQPPPIQQPSIQQFPIQQAPTLRPSIQQPLSPQTQIYPVSITPQIQSPPRATYQSSALPPSPHLSSYGSSSNVNPAPNNVAPPSNYPQKAPIQQQRYTVTSPSQGISLPQFPSVPTTIPGYDVPRQNGVAQSEERKEALLIDL